jgi:16S rRNA processing protein RimM
MSERVAIGRVGKPHGLDGAFFVEGASEDPRWFKVGSKLHVGDQELAVVVARHGAQGRPVIRLEQEVARGAILEVPFEALPPVAEGEYYRFQLVGLEVLEEGGRDLGSVLEVEPGIANDVLALEGGLRLPLVEACVRDIDLEARRILVAPGFADLP